MKSAIYIATIFIISLFSFFTVTTTLEVNEYIDSVESINNELITIIDQVESIEKELELLANQVDQLELNVDERDSNISLIENEINEPEIEFIDTEILDELNIDSNSVIIIKHIIIANDTTADVIIPDVGIDEFEYIVFDAEAYKKQAKEEYKKKKKRERVVKRARKKKGPLKKLFSPSRF